MLFMFIKGVENSSKFPKLIIFATTKLLKEGGMCPKDLVGNDYQRAVFFNPGSLFVRVRETIRTIINSK